MPRIYLPSAGFFLILLLSGISFSLNCTLDVQRLFDGNNTSTSISLRVYNSNTNQNCSLWNFSFTEHMPERMGDMGQINYSLSPDSISGRGVSWKFRSLEQSETIAIDYWASHYVQPRVIKDFPKLGFTFASQAKLNVSNIAPASEFSYYPLSPDGNYSIVFQNKIAVAIAANPESGKSQNHSLVANLALVSDALSSRLQTSRESLNIALSGMHASALEFGLAKKSAQSSCKILLGTDRNKCDSYASCQYACYSVTSFCLPIALGSGQSFINSIWELENLTRSLDIALENERGAYQLATASPRKDTIAAYRHAIRAINKNATSIAYNSLVGGVCATPDFKFASLTSSFRAMDYAIEDFLIWDELNKSAAKFVEFANLQNEKITNKTADKNQPENKTSNANQSANTSGQSANAQAQNSSASQAANISQKSANASGQNSAPSQSASKPSAAAGIKSESQDFALAASIALVAFALLAFFILNKRKKAASR